MLFSILSNLQTCIQFKKNVIMEFPHYCFMLTNILEVLHYKKKLQMMKCEKITHTYIFTDINVQLLLPSSPVVWLQDI